MQWPRPYCSAYSLDCDYSGGHGRGLGWYLPVLLRRRRRRQHLRLPRAPLARGGPAAVDGAASGPHRGGRRGRPRPGLSQDGPEPAWPRIARRHRQLHGRSGAGRARRRAGRWARKSWRGLVQRATAACNSTRWWRPTPARFTCSRRWASRSSPRCRRLSTTGSTDGRPARHVPKPGCERTRGPCPGSDAVPLTDPPADASISGRRGAPTAQVGFRRGPEHERSARYRPPRQLRHQCRYLRRVTGRASRQDRGRGS